MSASISQSLDDIIKAQKAARPARSGRSVRSARVVKASRPGVQKKSAAKPKQEKPAAKTSGKKRGGDRKSKAAAEAAALAALPDGIRYSKRAVVSNLPVDLTEAQVKAYFQEEIGPVSAISTSYDAKRIPTGQFSLTFRTAGDAAKAMQKLNNMPIVNGKKSVKVEVVYDQDAANNVSKLLPLSQLKNISTKQAKKSAAPVAAASGSGVSREGKRSSWLQEKKKAREARKSGNSAAAPAASAKKTQEKQTKKKQGREKTKRVAKTQSELDAEMDDYFNNEEVV